LPDREREGGKRKLTEKKRKRKDWGWGLWVGDGRGGGEWGGVIMEKPQEKMILGSSEGEVQRMVIRRWTE